MRIAASISILVLLVIAAAAVVCFGPWYHWPAVAIGLSLLKPFGLLLGAVLAGLVAARLSGPGGLRPAWAVLSVGLGLQASGQGIIAFHQVVASDAVPFPSLGDAFFTASLGFMLWALFAFSWRSYRSGLSLGGRWRFWWPAPVIGSLSLLAGLICVTPALKADDGWLATGLNVLYPTYSAIALVPAAVMLRLAIRFRGGRLLLVWLPITVGLVATLAADVLFAWLTGLKAAWAMPLVDWLYLSAYLLLPTGILFQLSLMGRALGHEGAPGQSTRG